MTITITPEILCALCIGRFSLEACEAICNYFDECGENACPYIAEICLGFAEISAEDFASEYGEDEEYLIETLENGNVLIAL